ncbi:MAG: hypothetical protein AB8B74_13020 [Crocinitomicaceae bacterium]
MKYTVLILWVLSIFVSCKKKEENAFLTGQLLEDCNGTPLSNKKVYLYQNFVPKNNILLSNTKESILETTTTNEEGKFYFWAEDHTNKYTNSKANISVRLNEQSYLVDGTIGNAKGKESDQSLNYIQDVGKLYYKTSAVVFNIVTDTVFNNISLDSIVFLGSQALLIATVIDKTDGQFKLTFSSEIHQPIVFDPYETLNNGKHKVYIGYSCYKNGDRIHFGSQYIYAFGCQPDQTIYLQIEE